MHSLPPGQLREDALGRIQSLDPAAKPPPRAAAWQRALEAARVDDKAYAKAFAETLRNRVCLFAYDAIYTLGSVFRRGFGDAYAYAAAFDLIDDLMNKDGKACPVAATLTDADRAKLLEFKQRHRGFVSPGGQGEAK